MSTVTTGRVVDPGTYPLSLEAGTIYKCVFTVTRGQLKKGSGSWCIARCQVIDLGGSTSSQEIR